MKKSFTPAVIFICIFLTLHAYSQLPAVVKDWAKFAGNQDSTFKAPIVSDDSGYTYVGTFTVNTITGADILVIKYNSNGDTIWTRTWSGGGNGRDQASGITVDEKSVYVCGITYTSTANNYDYVTLCLSKKTGAINWVSTYNGSASNFDIATAIAVNDSGVYVTGISNDSNTTLDYMTVKYSPITGVEGWRRVYDYDSLDDIPFAIAINYDTIVVVTGGSQRNQYDWDYATISYSAHGTRRDTVRVTGSAAGFDRATAVKTDASGNIYITGTISQTTSGYDIKTVKINPNGTVAWQATYDNSNGTDEGVDLIVDASGNVYICGKSYSSAHNFDYVVRKYNSSGTVQWTGRMDLTNGVDEPKKMCFDSYGNIVVTGKGYNSATESFDFFTIALSPSGDKVWRETYGVVTRGDDGAEDIAADNNGNIYVTGEVVLELGTNPQTVTIKYRTDYYTDPQQIDTPSVANYFYPNYGQIAGEEGKGMSEDDLNYYTVHHYPQLYFQPGKMNMVFSKIDQDTSTTDTLQRVDVSFLNSNNETKAIPIKQTKDSIYLNYFLGHCPDGITNVTGIEKLLYTEIYGDIDAIYSSNNAGLKLYFICKPYSDPGNIGLLFEGQDDLQIVNNWGLQVQTSIGNYEFEKPRVYEIDSGGNVIALTWLLSWNIPQAGQAVFTGWGSYDHGKTLVIEIGPAVLSNSNLAIDNLFWSTYYGFNGGEVAGTITRDENHLLYSTCHTRSDNFINVTGQFQDQLSGITDIVITQFSKDPGGNTNIKWATYFGGEGTEESRGIAVNNTTGDIYFTGSTNSPGLGSLPLPTINPNNSTFYYNTLQSTGVCPLPSNYDAFLARLSNNGKILKYATYIGSANCDGGFAVAINQNDNSVYVGGNTRSGDDGANQPLFPVISSSETDSYNQNIFGGGTGNGDGFLMKFDDSDNCLWSTLFGGNGDEVVCGITVTGDEKIIITGATNSSDTDVPTSSGQPCLANNNNKFQVCDPGGSRYFDDSFNSTNNNQSDCFIAGFNIQDQLLWSTYFGGWEEDHTIPWSPISTTYVPSEKFSIVGYTGSSTSSSPSFPTKPQTNGYNQTYGGGTSDAFIASFNGFDEVWCSFYGGSNDDFSIGVTYDSWNNVYMTGSTISSVSTSTCQPPSSGEFPICALNPNYYTASYNAGIETYLTGFNLDYQMIWSTYIGGTGSDQGFSLITDGDKLFTWGNSNSPSVSPYPQVDQTGYYTQLSVLNGNSDAYISMFKIDQAVGIEEINLTDIEVLIYPNPVNNYIEINFNSKIEIKEKKLSFEIIDLSGRNLLNNSLELINQHQFKRKISTENFTQGMYFVKINFTEGSVIKKFIKQ